MIYPKVTLDISTHQMSSTNRILKQEQYGIVLYNQTQEQLQELIKKIKKAMDERELPKH
jgi:uncharacterized protein (DUF2344 family)